METGVDPKPQVVGGERFNVVQDILDCNKILINEININHEARTPEGLARNVILIEELNKNITEVLKLYKDISATVEDSILRGRAAQPAAVHHMDAQ